MEKITITYPDGSTKEFPKNTTFHEIVKDVKTSHEILAIKLDQQVLPLSAKANQSEKIGFVDITQLAGVKLYQAGLKFLFLNAVMELYPDAEVRFLHSVPRGILSEVYMTHNLTSEDVSKIKSLMASYVEKNMPFQTYNMDVKEAHKYYKKVREDEKAAIIDSLSTKVVSMYRLGERLNFFYNIMPYSTGSLKQFELVFLGKNRIVIVSPNVASNGKVPEYVHYENIVENFMNSKKWLRRMGVPYLSTLNYLVSHSKIKEFMDSNELLYERDLMRAAEHIISMRDVRMVLIAGPSSSGKTTTMKRLSDILRSMGYDPVGLSTDDFFVDRIDTPRNEFGQYDYECLQAIDLELFNTTLKKLLKGEKTEIPIYDFVNGKKIYKDRKLQLSDNSILLIEGLHCLNDDLIPYIESKYKFKIYLSPFMPLSIDRHNYISTLDLRLIRRMVRDFGTRGKSVDDTISEWNLVRVGEEKYIFPYVYQADMIINTALAYEIGVLKVYALPLLLSVGVESPYYSEARRLADYLQGFFPIPKELVKETSVLREFIG
ncbi:MAG: hypothetical protein IJ743_01785 [Bacilli bacterium]|nr:hypothetical protein [Bacilli bacterium]